jgi:hypothetical protein
LKIEKKNQNPIVDNVTNSNNKNTPMINFNPFNTQQTEIFLIPFNLGLPYLVHTLMMEGKKGGSTVSTGSTVKPEL